MLEWKENENELDEALVLNDNVTMNVLHEFGLYKFFFCLNMRSQLLLLQHLVDMWDPDVGKFLVGDQTLQLEIEEISFLTRLSQRGATMVLVRGQREPTDPVDQYIVQYCRDGVHKSSNKFPI